MKNLVIIFFVLGSINLSIGQEFESIVDTNKIWVVFQESGDGPPGGFGKSFAYKIADSILLDSNYWFKVWESQDSLFSNWNEYGYIREEYKRVRYINPNHENQEIILYDFNLEINDTIDSFCPDEWGLTIYAIDTMLYAGKERVVQYIDENNWRIIKHIEGIGSSEGLIGPASYCAVGAIWTLQCVYENDEVIYHNPIYESCYIYNPYTCHAEFSYQIDSMTVFFTNASTGYYDETIWSFGDDEYYYEENPIYTFQDTGSFLVTLIIYDSFGGCTHQYSEIIPITGTSSELIHRNTLNEDVEIYPNPVKDKLYIKNSKIGLKYTIINSVGKIITEGELMNYENELDFPYTKGIYLIELRDKFDRIRLTKKIIK